MTTNQWTELHDELCGIFNRLSVDDYTNTPDYILADLVRGVIENIAVYNKTNMEWHGWKGLGDQMEKIKS